MAATSSALSTGLGLVLVEFEYEYEGRDGDLVSIKPNERYVLLAKTNDHWWQVRSDGASKPFYIPAKYVRELPADFPSLLDFAEPAALEPATVPVAAPVPVPIPVPVPVPVPKPLEETKPKAGDEVTIRLRPDGAARHHKHENRMSTFGVPLDFHDPAPSRPFSHLPAGPAETSISETGGHVADGPKPLQGLLRDDLADSGKPRVPSFSPADPLPAGRPHAQPVPVETPVVPPDCKTLDASPSSTEPSQPEEEAEEVILEEEASSEEEEEAHRDQDTNHIYESIQDLNLDLEALIGDKAIPARPSEPAPAPPTTQTPGSVPIYANVSSLRKASSGADAPSPDHTPSSSVSSSDMISPASPASPPSGWQAHTDHDSGKVFYYHPLTRQTTWSDPRCPPPGSDLDPSGGGEGTSPSPLLSPASSQGSSSWERLVDEVSGRFYYYNPSTGATAWTAPGPPSPASPASPPGPAPSRRQEDGPPPLPEEDYPAGGPGDSDSVFTAPAVSIPRAQLDPSSPQWRQQELQFLHLPQRMMGNGVSEDGAAPAARGWRHSVAEDTFAAHHRRNASDFSDTHRRRSPDSPQLSDRYGLKRNLSNRSADSPQLHCHLLEKAGILNKTKVADNGKRIRKNWSQSWTVLHGGILTFHRDPKSAPSGNASKASQIVPEYTVELRGSSVGWASKDKSSKKNVLELRTRQGCEYLMQYDTESIITDWLKVIQDTIRQLEQEHVSEDEDDASDREDRDRKSTSRSGSGPDSEQRRVRTKLRRFLQRRPTLQSVKERGYIRDNVFGCHLDTLCHRENTNIPKFVEKCIKTVERRGLDVDGIYRVSGNLAVIQKLRHKADHEEQLDLEDGQWEEIHVVTGALKLFLRELPEPLFPFSCFDKFIAAIQIPDHSLKVSYMKDLVQTLPLPNHDTMELLFRHLRRVIDHKESNRMSFQSVAIVFGPTLLRPQTESANMTINMVYQSQIVELMLKEFHTVFCQR